jgi:uncharacterized protein YjbI with pentapeptide repeats
MNIESSDLLYCVAQPFALKGDLHQSLTIGLGFDLLTRRVIPAARALGAAMGALQPGECLDMGLPKREAEWLMAAFAFAPRGKAAASLVARVRVGASERRFLLTGEADASGKTFASAPMRWQETFGAPGHPENPLGCGLAPDPASGRVRAPRLVGADDPHGRPACPGAMGAWPARMRNMGSYDAKWQKTRCPDLPDDCDLSYLNLAQRAQRLPGIKGDEEVFLSGLHAEHPEIRTRLPGKTVRVYARRAEKAEEESWILPYDTLWLFPNQLVGLLLGHLLLPCADSAASDVAYVRFEMTPPDPVEAAPPEVPKVAPPPPPPPDAVAPPEAAVDAAALSPEVKKAAEAASAAASAVSSDTASASSPPPAEAPPAPSFSPESAARMQADAIDELQRSLPDINAALAQAGLPPMTPEQVEETKAQIVAQTTRMREIMQQAEAAPEPNLQDTLRQAGVSEKMIRGVDAVMEISPPDPADHSDALSWRAAVDSYLARFEQHLPLSESARATQHQTLLLMGPGGDDVLEKMTGPTPTLTEALTRAGLAPEQAARLSGEIDRMPAFDSLPELKAHLGGMEQRVGFAPGSMTQVVEAVQKAAEQSGIPLDSSTAAALSKPEDSDGKIASVASSLATSAAVSAAGKAALDAVKGAGAEGAGAELAGAGITSAADTPPPSPPPPPAGDEVLSYAYQDLAGRDFSGKKLNGADFTHAKLKGANFSGASLQGADFDHADCEEANFAKAALDRASFQETRCVKACFSDASATSARFVKADLSAANAAGLRAERAEWDGAALSGAALRGAFFQGALIKNLSAAGLDAEGADFSDANCLDCDFSGANFQGANWQAALVSGARLEGADLRGANLNETTMMGGTRLAKADLAGAKLTGGDWRAVDARQSRFDACDAGEASFNACQLEGSRWNLAKALGANFSRSQLSGADFSRANLMQASLRESRVAGANFSAANLYGADLYRADMDLAEVRDALLENTLLFARRNAE